MYYNCKWYLVHCYVLQFITMLNVQVLFHYFHALQNLLQVFLQALNFIVQWCFALQIIISILCKQCIMYKWCDVKKKFYKFFSKKKMYMSVCCQLTLSKYFMYRSVHENIVSYEPVKNTKPTLWNKIKYKH